jgi:DNA polymerase-3 subunit epsilon
VRGGADGGGCFPTGRHYPGIAHLLRIVAAGLCDEWGGELAVSHIPLVSIDTETTGRDPALDRIVEIACVVSQGAEVLSRHSWLVNPGRPIPQEASDVHGIQDEQVRDKPPFSNIVGELFAVLRRGVPVAYNAEFDKQFLLAELARVDGARDGLPPAARKGIEWVDPLVWARELHRDEKSKALGDVCERLGIQLTQAHRAEHDAEAALHVFAAFCADPRVPKSYAGLIQEQRRLARLFDEERVRWRNRAN